MESVEARVGSCVWCGEPLEGRGRRLHGRTVCPECGAATTDPWPPDEVLESAYRGWYRPESGRFSFIGDPLLRRTRALLAARPAPVPPPGARAGGGGRAG